MNFKFPLVDTMMLRVAARYKSKKKLDTGNVVYEYGPRQIAKRNKDKAERIEKLRGLVSKLRKKVKTDLKSSDAKTKYTALAVALMDHTYERVGNEDSAGEGHFGVTGWQKKHISFKGEGATIKYVGKSGVKHEKKVTDASIVKMLKEAHAALDGDDKCIFEYKDGCVDAKIVNDYLKEFDITAKDIRGLHANQEMQDRLKATRAKGKELPKDRKDRDKILKAEFKEALEGAAGAVGHEASTLRSQYLVPSLEVAYMKDGTVIEKLNEKVACDERKAPLLFADRIIRQLVDHMFAEDLVVEPQDYAAIRQVFKWCDGSWERFGSGDMGQNKLLSTIVVGWGKMPGRKHDMEQINV